MQILKKYLLCFTKWNCLIYFFFIVPCISLLKFFTNRFTQQIILTWIFQRWSSEIQHMRLIIVCIESNWFGFNWRWWMALFYVDKYENHKNQINSMLWFLIWSTNFININWSNGSLTFLNSKTIFSDVDALECSGNVKCFIYVNGSMYEISQSKMVWRTFA